MTGFKLYLNDGAGGTAFSEIDAGTVNDQPTYMEHTTTSVNGALVGNSYAFKIEAVTTGGSVTSSSVEYVLADVPDDPTVAPATDAVVTSKSKVKVDISVVAGDGGSPITSYSLEMDDGEGGDFNVLYGESSNSLSTTYTTSDITKGLTYRFRYRVRNAVGWSGYSPTGYIQAASKPEAPPAPTFVSATDSAIDMSLCDSADDGGAVVTLYKLYIDKGSGFVDVGNYDGVSHSYQATLTDHTLTAGQTYSFYYTAENAIGESDASP